MEVLIKVLQQGDAVCGSEGYMLKRSENVAAFYLDGGGKTGKIYPFSTSNSTYFEGSTYRFPSIWVDDGAAYSNSTEICFPEYEGWRVHCIGGGKTMAICLVKD